MKTIQKLAAASLLLSAVLIISSCDNGESPSKTKLLIGKWKLTAYTYTNNGQTEDGFEDIDLCMRDNILFFKNSTTFEVLEGASRCNPADPEVVESGTWSLSANKDTVTLARTGEIPEALLIVTLNGSSLKLREVIGGPFNESNDRTYAKQQ